jgi:hypothetical protein
MNFEWPTFAYMNILNTRARILCNRNEKIINQKFVLCKVGKVAVKYFESDFVEK